MKYFFILIVIIGFFLISFTKIVQLYSNKPSIVTPKTNIDLFNIKFKVDFDRIKESVPELNSIYDIKTYYDPFSIPTVLSKKIKIPIQKINIGQYILELEFYSFESDLKNQKVINIQYDLINKQSKDLVKEFTRSIPL